MRAVCIANLILLYLLILIHYAKCKYRVAVHCVLCPTLSYFVSVSATLLESKYVSSRNHILLCIEFFVEIKSVKLVLTCITLYGLLSDLGLRML
jgi:hypothetical protein